MLLLAPVAIACDTAVLRVLPLPVPVAGEPAVASGEARSGEQPLSGAIVALDSRWSVEDWARVLFHPEDHDLWSPPEIGVMRAERIAEGAYYQLIDIPLLWGAMHIRRQTITDITWSSRSGKLENCWQAVPVVRFAEQVRPYDVGEAWQEVGLGGWLVEPRPAGGSRATYQFWTQPDLVPTKVQAWAMSKTLPTLILSFEQRVGEMATSAAR